MRLLVVVFFMFYIPMFSLTTEEEYHGVVEAFGYYNFVVNC